MAMTDAYLRLAANSINNGGGSPRIMLCTNAAGSVTKDTKYADLTDPIVASDTNSWVANQRSGSDVIAHIYAVIHPLNSAAKTYNYLCLYNSSQLIGAAELTTPWSIDGSGNDAAKRFHLQINVHQNAP